MRGGDKKSANARIMLFRCVATGKVAPLREHVEKLCAEFPRADYAGVKANIYTHGTWYGRRFERVTAAEVARV
jgi:hypothetical protein